MKAVLAAAAMLGAGCAVRTPPPVMVEIVCPSIAPPALYALPERHRDFVTPTDYAVERAVLEGRHSGSWPSSMPGPTPGTSVRGGTPSMAGPDGVDLGHALALPPREAIEYFGAKRFRISHDWREVWQDAQASAFTVSKMARFDLLASTRQRIDAKLRSGITRRELERDLEALLRAEGWWGRQIVSDAAGGAEVVQLGSPWRIRTIIRTNVATAYNAGRYRRQIEQADARPYWQYLAIRDASSRPSHAALHGKVFRADDPVWDSIYPPNGFGCRCRTRSLTERQIRRRGLEVIEDTRSVNVAQKVGVDKRTDEPIIRPGTRVEWTDAQGRAQEFQPDPGWSHNPGRHALPPPDPLNARAVAGQPAWKDYGRPDVRQIPAASAPPPLPRAESRAAALARVNEALGLTGRTNWRKVRTPVDDVVVRRGLTPHIVQKFDGGEDRSRYAARILPTLETPDEVWMTWYDSGEFRKRYVKVWDDDRGSMTVVTESKDGSLLYNFVPGAARSLNRQRTGVLLHPRSAFSG